MTLNLRMWIWVFLLVRALKPKVNTDYLPAAVSEFKFDWSRHLFFFLAKHSTFYWQMYVCVCLFKRTIKAREMQIGHSLFEKNFPDRGETLGLFVVRKADYWTQLERTSSSSSSCWRQERDLGFISYFITWKATLCVSYKPKLDDFGPSVCLPIGGYFKERTSFYC